MNINNVAGWFYDNNQIIRSLEDNKYLMSLCLLVKAALLNETGQAYEEPEEREKGMGRAA